MEIGMGGIEAGLLQPSKPKEIKPIKVEGKNDQEIIEQLLDNISEPKKEGLRELIASSGDRELVGLLLSMNNLLMQRKKLYQQYEEAPANKKLEFSQKLIAKWEEVEAVGGKMDQKIARVLLTALKETLKESK